VIAVVGWIGVMRAGASQPPAGVDLAGKPVDPLRANPGKPAVLIFVRTDCPISNRYAPTIQRLSAQYAGKAAFWLVYPDKSESSAAIEQHLRDYEYKLPALHDPQHALVKLGQAQITPEVAVFDASGQLVYHGRIDNWYVTFGHARPAPTTHELDDALQAILKGNKPQVATASGVGCYISDLE
jgi:thiol-disulfide isomerase/thioredoxin